ncbi:MAG: hypothetical protein JWN75_126 [Candidatus Saccharibacteria bacterium]|nr:hypothetical protein [Candidatus Saccharibacteria bacterium]
MMLINEAYGVLSNGLLRREYDRRYAAQQTTAANGSYNEYAAHPPYSQTDSSDFLRRREAAATYNRESHEQSAPLSFLWVWMGVFAMIVFGFLAYQLYDIVQTPANTGGDIPVSGIINSSTRSSNYRSGNYYSNYSNLN